MRRRSPVSNGPPLLPKAFKIAAGIPVAQIEMASAQKAGQSEEERLAVFHFRPRQAGSLRHQQKRNLIIFEAHGGSNRFEKSLLMAAETRRTLEHFAFAAKAERCRRFDQLCRARLVEDSIVSANCAF